MGEQLLKIYDEATKLGGGWARARLAKITCISSPKAKNLPDSPEYLQRFNTALETIKRDLKLMWFRY